MQFAELEKACKHLGTFVISYTKSFAVITRNVSNGVFVVFIRDTGDHILQLFKDSNYNSVPLEEVFINETIGGMPLKPDTMLWIKECYEFLIDNVVL